MPKRDTPWRRGDPGSDVSADAVTARCACGCGAALVPKCRGPAARYAGPACRMRQRRRARHWAYGQGLVLCGVCGRWLLCASTAAGQRRARYHPDCAALRIKAMRYGRRPPGNP